MDLAKFLPKNHDKDTYEYFWSLIIEPGWVQAGIWRIERNEAQVNFSGIPIAWSSEEDLVGSTDSALSAAIQNLPDNTPEPTKTVFGVVSSWVEGGQIKSENLDKIKTICAELSLKPVGFVVISEAIAHYVKTEEGGPLSAIVVGVYKENLEISIFNLGSLLGTTKVSRSISFPEDIAEGLSRFSGSQSLPSRFIMYDGREGEIEEARQSLLATNWDNHDNLRFLHTPKVEIVESSEKLKAICLAGASEMASVEKVSLVNDEPEQNKKDIAASETAESFGFTVSNQLPNDIQQEDVSEEPLEIAEEESLIDEAHQNVVPIKSFNDEKDVKKHVKLPIQNPIGNLKEKVRNILRKIKIGRIKPNFGQTPIIAGLIVLALLTLGTFGAWWFVPKATVTIYVSPKTLNENFEAIVGSSDSSDKDRTIPARLGKITVDDESTINTTGTKTVGDRAKGQVVIYRAGTSMTLPASTVIKGPNNLQFSLDEAVNIASGSASSPSSTKVNITAANIGASYNLSSGTSFTVGSYSLGDLEAKNENAFSGGSSREVNVISEEDIKNLEDDLSNSLQDKAKLQMEEQLSDDESLIETSFKSKADNKKFSGKVGDESSTLKLELTMDVEGYVVKKSDINLVAMEYLKDKVPQGFILKENNIQTKFELVEGTTDSKYKISVVANLLPDVNLQELGKKILGKYPEVAKNYMSKNVPGFTGVEIEQRPTLPGKLGTLPRIYKNLEMELAAQR